MASHPLFTCVFIHANGEFFFWFSRKCSCTYLYCLAFLEGIPQLRYLILLMQKHRYVRLVMGKAESYDPEEIKRLHPR
jgi:hypothetical protein